MPLVGVDIGTTSIKLCALERDGDGVRMVAEGIVPLLPGAMTEGTMERPLEVSLALESAFEEYGLTGADVVVSLPFVGDIILEREEAPPPGVLFESWARTTAEEAVPFDANDIVIATERAPADGVAVRFVVAKRDRVSEYTGAVVRAGAGVVSFEPGFLALERYHRVAHPDEQQAVGLLDVGLDTPSIAVVQSGRLLLSNVFLCDLRARVRELPTMIDVRLRARVGEGIVSRLRLCGGVSQIRGLREALRDRLRIPVDPLGPGVLPFPPDPVTAVARGLALRLIRPGVSPLA